MSEHIERKKVLELISSWKRDDIYPHRVDYPEGWNEALEQIESDIEDMPAADVAPVIHSSWEEIKDVPHGIWDYHFRCKHCGGNTPQAAYVVAPDYCPNCGAKMGGRDDENNDP